MTARQRVLPSDGYPVLKSWHGCGMMNEFIELSIPEDDLGCAGNCLLKNESRTVISLEYLQ
jgi:hypothetical protein